MENLIKIVTSFFGTFFLLMLLVYLLLQPEHMSDTAYALGLIVSGFLTARLYLTEIRSDWK